MPMLEYTQKDHADTIQGRVMAGADLKQEGTFQIDIAHNGEGWAWSMNVEIGGKTIARTETESDHPYENLTWREAAALAKNRVVELATELEAKPERGGPPPTPPRNSEKEDSMAWKDPDYEHYPHEDTRKADEEALIGRGIEPEREPEVYKPPLWERVGAVVGERVEAFFDRVDAFTGKANLKDPDYEHYPHEDTRKADVEERIRVDKARDQTVSRPLERESAPQSESDPPGGKWPILCRAGAVSPGDTIEPAAGRWFTVVELGEATEPPKDQAGIRPYGTGRAPGEQWQTAYCRDATLPEIHVAQNAQREQSGEERRLDVSTPGPTEAAGGSFQVFDSKADAEHHARRLPQSQETRLDRIIAADGPTDSYAVTSLPAPAEVARDERVAQRVGQIQDPERRGEAERLLRIIREEGAARDRSTQRVQEATLER